MTDSWIKILGKNSPDIEADLAQSLVDLKQAKKFTLDDQKYIAAVDFLPVKKDLILNSEELEKLRLMCQLHDVDLRSSNFTSHRPLIGPLIVAFKKIMFPILKLFFKDFIRQQRQFNAACIAAIAASLNKQSK